MSGHDLPSALLALGRVLGDIGCLQRQVEATTDVPPQPKRRRSKGDTDKLVNTKRQSVNIKVFSELSRQARTHLTTWLDSKFSGHEAYSPASVIHKLLNIYLHSLLLRDRATERSTGQTTQSMSTYDFLVQSGIALLTGAKLPDLTEPSTTNSMSESQKKLLRGAVAREVWRIISEGYIACHDSVVISVQQLKALVTLLIAGGGIHDGLTTQMPIAGLAEFVCTFLLKNDRFGDFNVIIRGLQVVAMAVLCTLESSSSAEAFIRVACQRCMQRSGDVSLGNPTENVAQDAVPCLLVNMAKWVYHRSLQSCSENQDTVVAARMVCRSLVNTRLRRYCGCEASVVAARCMFNSDVGSIAVAKKAMPAAPMWLLFELLHLRGATCDFLSPREYSSWIQGVCCGCDGDKIASDMDSASLMELVVVWANAWNRPQMLLLRQVVNLQLQSASPQHNANSVLKFMARMCVDLVQHQSTNEQQDFRSAYTRHLSESCRIFSRHEFKFSRRNRDQLLDLFEKQLSMLQPWSESVARFLSLVYWPVVGDHLLERSINVSNEVWSVAACLAKEKGSQEITWPGLSTVGVVFDALTTIFVSKSSDYSLNLDSVPPDVVAGCALHWAHRQLWLQKFAPRTIDDVANSQLCRSVIKALNHLMHGSSRSSPDMSLWLLRHCLGFGAVCVGHSEEVGVDLTTGKLSSCRATRVDRVWQHPLGHPPLLIFIASVVVQQEPALFAKLFVSSSEGFDATATMLFTTVQASRLLLLLLLIGDGDTPKRIGLCLDAQMPIIEFMERLARAVESDWESLTGQCRRMHPPACHSWFVHLFNCDVSCVCVCVYVCTCVALVSIVGLASQDRNTLSFLCQARKLRKLSKTINSLRGASQQ